MEYIYLVVLVFIFSLSCYDLTAGVSTDAGNFLSAGMGSKTAKLKVLFTVAAVGIFVGAITSNGMMDIARHGILNPDFYYMSEVICIFLAVGVSDVILLDIFNTLGMPTSSTVSMVFELLGGSTALAIVKLMNNSDLTYAQLINTDKALSIILGIFLSVAIAFVFGYIVMWITRLVFTFKYKDHSRWAMGIFGGISITLIMFFLLVSGLGKSSFMTAEVKSWIETNQATIFIGCFLLFSIIMQVLYAIGVNIFRIIVLFGTFALAMAFAGNDLVNFIGVPLAALSSYQYYVEAGAGDPSQFCVSRLHESAHTPIYFLIIAGAIMVIALITSKKARKVINTSVNLSRQDAGEEIFSSSKIARSTVRNVMSLSNTISKYIPNKAKRWLDTRFNSDEAIMADGAAFDLVRASVNLVLAGLLIIIGTSLQLPLSTTYVAFMVAMGSSLADRAWGRETAVYRITGVVSVIGGWFITAGAAFILCFCISLFMYFVGPIAMLLAIALVVFIIIRNNKMFKKHEANENKDQIFRQLIRTNDKVQVRKLLGDHVQMTQLDTIDFARNNYLQIINGLINDDYKTLRHSSNALDEQKSLWKKMRRKELIGMKKIDYLTAIEKNTWFHLGCNSISQTLYCLKRMSDPCLEHIDNRFNPLPEAWIKELIPLRDQTVALLDETRRMIAERDYSNADKVLVDANAAKRLLSETRDKQEVRMQTEEGDLQIGILYLNTLQETQELISTIRHLLRASRHFFTA
jgi:hypothetical protein